MFDRVQNGPEWLDPVKKPPKICSNNCCCDEKRNAALDHVRSLGSVSSATELRPLVVSNSTTNLASVPAIR